MQREGSGRCKEGKKMSEHYAVYSVISGPLAQTKPRWSSSSWGSVVGSQITVIDFWFEATKGPMFSNLRPETVLSWSRTSMTAWVPSAPST